MYDTQFTPHSKHTGSITNTEQLVLSGASVEQHTLTACARHGTVT